MAKVRLCGVDELPESGTMRMFPAGAREICVVNDGGVFAMIDNVCPHRQGPLAEGTLEQGKVLCPWHAWAFDLTTGCAEHDADQRVAVFPFAIVDEQVLLELES